MKSNWAGNWSEKHVWISRISSVSVTAPWFNRINNVCGHVTESNTLLVCWLWGDLFHLLSFFLLPLWGGSEGRHFQPAKIRRVFLEEIIWAAAAANVMITSLKQNYLFSAAPSLSIYPLHTAAWSDSEELFGSSFIKASLSLSSQCSGTSGFPQQSGKCVKSP